jgi:hypothetical protein
MFAIVKYPLIPHPFDPSFFSASSSSSSSSVPQDPACYPHNSLPYLWLPPASYFLCNPSPKTLSPTKSHKTKTKTKLKSPQKTKHPTEEADTETCSSTANTTNPTNPTKTTNTTNTTNTRNQTTKTPSDYPLPIKPTPAIPTIPTTPKKETPKQEIPIQATPKQETPKQCFTTPAVHQYPHTPTDTKTKFDTKQFDKQQPFCTPKQLFTPTKQQDDDDFLTQQIFKTPTKQKLEKQIDKQIDKQVVIQTDKIDKLDKHQIDTKQETFVPLNCILLSSFFFSFSFSPPSFFSCFLSLPSLFFPPSAS